MVDCFKESMLRLKNTVKNSKLATIARKVKNSKVVRVLTDNWMVDYLYWTMLAAGTVGPGTVTLCAK